MAEQYLSIEDVASQLSLHPKTVRRFISEGRLEGSRAGRKWRIRRRDLELFLSRRAGPPAAAGAADSTVSAGAASRQQSAEAPREEERSVRVSAVVDVEAIDAEEAMRISSSILAALNSQDPARGRTRYDHVYYPDERRAQLVFWGEPDFVSTMLRLLSHIGVRESERE